MAEKPPEEGYISVVDEEPEILELLKWDAPQMQKSQEQPAQEKPKTPEKRGLKQPEIDPFELSEPEFIETYRLSKDLARKLCEELKPIMSETAKPVEVSVESKMLAALAYFASGKYQKAIGGKTDPAITAYFVSASVMQVTQAMNHPSIVKKYIHFPHLREERDVIKARFYMKYGMPNVVGCIDCTHVPIPKPDEDQKSHFNKSYHSKKVQIICDSEHTILSVDPSPGSHSHDGVLTRHAVKVDLETLNNNHEHAWLVGSAYYSLKSYIMTPVPKVTKKSPVSPEKYYNGVHAQTHSVVLETMKHLKSRWKCLQATCNKQFDPALMSMMVVACCILHNICNRRGLPICPMTQAEERLEIMKQKVASGPIPKKLNDDEAGLRVRGELISRLWSERRLEPDGPKKRAKRDKPVEVHQNPDDEAGLRVRGELISRLWSERRLEPDGPKKRAKRDKPVEVHQNPGPPPLPAVQPPLLAALPDESKRPRMAPPPTYSLMQPSHHTTSWHYQHQHQPHH